LGEYLLTEKPLTEKPLTEKPLTGDICPDREQLRRGSEVGFTKTKSGILEWGSVDQSG
jgi:hypothetical protein